MCCLERHGLKYRLNILEIVSQPIVIYVTLKAIKLFMISNIHACLIYRHGAKILESLGIRH